MKQLIQNIYLRHGKAYAGYAMEAEILSEYPAELAAEYRAMDFDALLVFDLSSEDVEHEQNLDALKDICEVAEIPVIGAGNVKRMEDVKKILYTGCKRAAVNFRKNEGKEILEEVSKKFGPDKILLSVSEPEQISKENLPHPEFACGIITFGNEKEIGAMCPELPLTVISDLISTDSVRDLLGAEQVAAVASFYAHELPIQKLQEELYQKGLRGDALQTEVSFADLKTDDKGLVPVVVQDYKTDEVLMVAYMNEESFLATLKCGKMTYFSRSRQSLWLKGETSGHYQYVKSLTMDCDKDTLLAKVSQIGAACHTGNRTCFFQPIAEVPYEEKNSAKILKSVYDVISDRKLHPKEGSYTNYLFDKGIDKILKKVGEEATEIVIAAKNPNPNEIKYEISDFLYHVMVLMVERGVTWEDIMDDLSKR